MEIIQSAIGCYFETLPDYAFSDNNKIKINLFQFFKIMKVLELYGLMNQRLIKWMHQRLKSFVTIVFIKP